MASEVKVWSCCTMPGSTIDVEYTYSSECFIGGVMNACSEGEYRYIDV